MKILKDFIFGMVMGLGVITILFLLMLIWTDLFEFFLIYLDSVMALWVEMLGV